MGKKVSINLTFFFVFFFLDQRSDIAPFILVLLLVKPRSEMAKKLTENKRVRWSRRSAAWPGVTVMRNLLSVLSDFCFLLCFSPRVDSPVHRDGATLFACVYCYVTQAARTKAPQNNNNTKWKEETRSYWTTFRTWVKVAIWIASRSLKRRSAAATTTNACQWKKYSFGLCTKFSRVSWFCWFIGSNFLCAACWTMGSKSIVLW